MAFEVSGYYYESLLAAAQTMSAHASDAGKILARCATAAVAQVRRTLLAFGENPLPSDSMDLLVPLRGLAVASSAVITVALVTAALVARRRRQRRVMEEKKRALTAEVPEESRAAPEDEGSRRDLVAARFFNACMKRFYTDEQVVAAGARCWLAGINEKLSENDKVKIL